MFGQIREIKEEAILTYWTVCKRNKGKWLYISGTDEYGYPIHTENEKEAWQFRCLDTAMNFFGLGYMIQKH